MQQRLAIAFALIVVTPVQTVDSAGARAPTGQVIAVVGTRSSVMAGAAILFLAACAAQSAATVDATATVLAPLALTEEPVSLKTPTGEIFGTLELPAASTRVV